MQIMGQLLRNIVSHSSKKYVDFLPIHPTLSDMKQASLPSSIAERALARDKGCIFTGVSPSTVDSDILVATWIFPPFLGYVRTNNPWHRIDRALMSSVILITSWWQAI